MQECIIIGIAAAKAAMAGQNRGLSQALAASDTRPEIRVWHLKSGYGIKRAQGKTSPSIEKAVACARREPGGGNGTRGKGNCRS